MELQTVTNLYTRLYAMESMLESLCQRLDTMQGFQTLPLSSVGLSPTMTLASAYGMTRVIDPSSSIVQYFITFLFLFFLFQWIGQACVSTSQEDITTESSTQT